MTTVDLDDLLNAYEFANSGGFGIDTAAYVCSETGAVYVTSTDGEFEKELPEDLETSDRYLPVPSKRDLDLGRDLVFRFTEDELPRSFDEVANIFRRKGAYGRFKQLLESHGALDRWLKFEAAEKDAALLRWCKENNLQVSRGGVAVPVSEAVIRGDDDARSIPTAEPAAYATRLVTAADAEAASALVHLSFTKLSADDWEPDARQFFLGESSAAALRTAFQSCAYAAGAFSGHTMIGFILMPKPSVLGMLFVHPDSLRLGIGKHLWEQARSHVEASFPEVKTVELNATPYALNFYRTIGFVPISAEFVRGGCRATRMACWLPARALGAGL
jgi:GNAT superfamily N-acetyltransferase